MLEIAGKTGIDSRNFAIPKGHPIMYAKESPLIDKQRQMFLTLGVDQATAAARKALAEWGGDIRHITHVVGVSSMAFSNPGFEFFVAENLGLNRNIERVVLHGVGCSGGLAALRNALTNVGFFYLNNHTVPPACVDAAAAFCPRLFALPAAEKERIRMVHSPHFFGYSRLGAELTKGRVDQREQFDFGTPHEGYYEPGDPDYVRLWGPAQVLSSQSERGPTLEMLTRTAYFSGRQRTRCLGSGIR